MSAVMIRATVLLVVLFTLFTVIAQAEAQAPRIVVRNDDYEVTGLPAISADGSTIAYLEPFETSSDASLVALVFVRVSDGTTIDRWVVAEQNDWGATVAPPADGRGTTPWRRGRNATLALRAAGYRAMRLVGEADPYGPRAPLQGHGLRVAQRRNDVVVRGDRDGHERWAGALPNMTAFCGMSDEHPVSAPPSVLAAWVDRGSSIAFLQYGHVYESCMCPSDLAFTPVTLTP
jgi:hypothetical protein